MRGRLHHKFYVEIAMLDAVATRNEAGPAPELTSGFDDDFGEIMVFTQAGARTDGRIDQPSIFLACNIESESWEALQQYISGNAPDTNLIIVVHRRDLEKADLINVERGEPLIRVNDKMVSVRDHCMRRIYEPRSPFYVRQVRPAFGIGMTPDLFNIVVEDRENFPKPG